METVTIKLTKPQAEKLSSIVQAYMDTLYPSDLFRTRWSEIKKIKKILDKS